MSRSYPVFNASLMSNRKKQVGAKRKLQGHSSMKPLYDKLGKLKQVTRELEEKLR